MIGRLTYLSLGLNSLIRRIQGFSEPRMFIQVCQMTQHEESETEEREEDRNVGVLRGSPSIYVSLNDATKEQEEGQIT